MIVMITVIISYVGSDRPLLSVGINFLYVIFKNAIFVEFVYIIIY